MTDDRPVIDSCKALKSQIDKIVRGCRFDNYEKDTVPINQVPLGDSIPTLALLENTIRPLYRMKYDEITTLPEKCLPQIAEMMGVIADLKDQHVTDYVNNEMKGFHYYRAPPYTGFRLYLFFIASELLGNNQIPKELIKITDKTIPILLMAGNSNDSCVSYYVINRASVIEHQCFWNGKLSIYRMIDPGQSHLVPTSPEGTGSTCLYNWDISGNLITEETSLRLPIDILCGMVYFPKSADKYFINYYLKDVNMEQRRITKDGFRQIQELAKQYRKSMAIEAGDIIANGAKIPINSFIEGYL